MEFYFYDPADHLFKPVSQEKLQTQLRALLIKCAEEMPNSVHKFNLFHLFRNEKTTREIIHRAKSILACDSSFFSVDSNNDRIKGQELHERIARLFVEQFVEQAEGRILLFNQAFDKFHELAKRRELQPLRRSCFKSIMQPLIREAFNVALRNDLHSSESKQVCGWKDLRVVDVESEMVNS